MASIRVPTPALPEDRAENEFRALVAAYEAACPAAQQLFDAWRRQHIDPD
jgi:hypothetical protein